MSPQPKETRKRVCTYLDTSDHKKLMTDFLAFINHIKDPAFSLSEYLALRLFGRDVTILKYVTPVFERGQWRDANVKSHELIVPSWFHVVRISDSTIAIVESAQTTEVKQ